jgi:hypothetical protein
MYLKYKWIFRATSGPPRRWGVFQMSERNRFRLPIGRSSRPKTLPLGSLIAAASKTSATATPVRVDDRSDVSPAACQIEARLLTSQCSYRFSRCNGTQNQNCNLP